MVLTFHVPVLMVVMGVSSWLGLAASTLTVGLAVVHHFNPVSGCSSLAQDWLSDTNFCRPFYNRD